MPISFRDPDLQDAFGRDGYVVLPLLSPIGIGRLREFYSSHLHPQKDQGFHATCHLDDSAYRREMRDGIAKVALASALEPLIEHRLVSANFVVKEPGLGEMPMHQDWSVVDERETVSVTVWCPLVDVGPENGALHLLRGSHTNVVACRGENAPGLPNFVTNYEAIPDSVVEDYDVTLNLCAGEAVFYDTRTVHFSPPNRSEETRVAINITVAPTGAKLVHQYRADEENVELIQIDETFFTDHPIGQRPRGAVLDHLPYRFDVLYSGEKPRVSRNGWRSWFRRSGAG